MLFRFSLLLSMTAKLALRIFGNEIIFQIDPVTFPQISQIGFLKRNGYDPKPEAILGQRSHGQAHPVHGDRPFFYQVRFSSLG